MSGRDELDDMTPEEIAAWAARNWAAAKEAQKDDPLPEISQVKKNDYPHWNLVAYMFHTRAGDRVMVGRDDAEVEGVLGGVRAARGQDELLVDLDGETWTCTRSDGKDWSPDRRGRTSRRPGPASAASWRKEVRRARCRSRGSRSRRRRPPERRSLTTR